ncbi:MAG: hypothetical protein IKQ40_02065, partial [Lachnospiraceae bacterium]|nr:hypothetical protein [Lachnospiraceae bacterium]
MKRYWLMPAMMVLMAVMLPVSEIAAKEPDYEPAAEAFADIQVPGDGDTSAGDDLFMSDSAPDDTFTGDMADELTGDIADDASGKETASDGMIAEEEKEAPEADSSGFGYATPISVNANVIDSVPDNDEKYYKFSLSKPGYVGFRFSHNYVNTGSGAWRL